MSGSETGGGVYEVTVEGALGPVMRCALRPDRADDADTCTTIRVAAEADLPGLVGMLESHGLVIQAVWLLRVRAPAVSNPAG